MKYKSIKGTRDILPDEAIKWQYLEKKIRQIMTRYNFREIRTPMFEETELFARSIGQHTDIVGKEMYTFLDRGRKSLTLKPEMTAPVIRAYIEHSLGETYSLLKLYYLSPIFRQENPQAGRFRQFHQFGAEIIG
ncbi:MAG: ATP phosphoribosyltransferase regulatory subunit, partial [candidate division KSB1 bacterium]|nr:ATP phosphoribosyltransferase regulatory subunit [candidate division KSB1 bacterium]